MTTLQQSTVKVETIGEQVDAFGMMAPTGKVKVTWLDNSTVEIQLPHWLTVDLLLSMQVGSTRPALLDKALGNGHSVSHATQGQSKDARCLSDRSSSVVPDEGSEFDSLFQNVDISEDVLKEQKAIGALVEKIQELDGQWLTVGTYRQTTRYYKNQDIAVLENAFRELAIKYPTEFEYDESINPVSK
ncbi:hypothetical protein H6F43_06965 [Leptolyngbya sp. FACHB-36]|uniref:hypothetical protein n=1 Tax=Leptolyngbya sp. FACHB-36 TaxID=2692808 RepID=UPI001680B84A|nr:hypothetical protein [Leptolyngbya sp. FACHB-36]MBD2019927.1 hypothetical protein [Leptolyngbya sp. FACHB-36]